MCKDLGHDHGHDLVHRLFGCTGWISDQKSSGAFPTEVCQSFSPNSWVGRSRQNQSYALAWGRYTNFHYNEVSGLCLALALSSAPQSCGNTGFQTY
jgi:hypothetical protein